MKNTRMTKTARMAITLMLAISVSSCADRAFAKATTDKIIRAATLTAEGKYSSAEKLAKQAIAEAQKQNAEKLEPVEPDRPSTKRAILVAQLVLADCYTAQGKYIKAEPLNQALKAGGEIANAWLSELHFDDDQTKVASYAAEHPAELEQLAGLLCASGELSKGIPLYQTLLKQSAQAAGEDSLKLAAIKCKLAVAYTLRENYSDAEPLFQQAEAIREKVLGDDHPAVASLLESYANMLERAGHEAEAKLMLARVSLMRIKFR